MLVYSLFTFLPEEMNKYSKAFFIVEIFIFFIILLFKRDKVIYAFLTFSFIEIKEFILICPFILLFVSLLKPLSIKNYSIHKINLFGMIILTYATVITVLMSFYDFFILSFILWLLTYGSTFLLLYLITIQEVSENEKFMVIVFFKKLLIYQLIIGILQMLYYKQYSTGDMIRGTFITAHEYGLFVFMLFIYIAFYFIYPLIAKGEKIINFKRFKIKFSLFQNIVILIILSPLLYFTDSKIMYACMVTGLLVSMIIASLIKNSFVSFKKIVICGIILVLILIPVYLNRKVNEMIDKTLDAMELLYIKKEVTSNKYVFYQRVFVDMKTNDGLLRWLCGVGAGNLGSRASNAFASDVLFKSKKEVPDFLPKHSSIYSKKYMSDLWTEEKYIYIGNFSFVFGYPFNGVCSIKGELGLIGLILQFLFCISMLYYIIKNGIKLNNNMRKWCIIIGSGWIFLLFHMVFDNTQDNVQIMSILSIVSAIIVSKKRKKYSII
jgi:hypothetical protein